MICGSGGGQIGGGIKRSLSFHFCSTKILKPRTKLFFVNILDGNERCEKIKLLPEVEHEQVIVGSLFEWNENMKGKKCFNQ